MVGLEVFTPVVVAFSRIAFGAMTLIILSLVTKTPLPPRWSWKYLFVASVLWVSIPWILFGFGETRVSSAPAGIIYGATHLMALIAIVLVFPEEKPTRERMLGLAVGFVGILVVVGIWNTGGADDGASIDLLAVAALGILGSGLAYLLNFKVVTEANATTASTVTYITPLVAVIVGSFF